MSSAVKSSSPSGQGDSQVNNPHAPLGDEVDTQPAKLPSKTEGINGKHVTLEPLSPSHVNELFAACGGEANKHLWNYIPDGPIATQAELLDSIQAKVSHDGSGYVFYTVVVPVSPELQAFNTQSGTGVAVGWLSLMNIDQKNRTIEVGYIVYGARLQRSYAATETMYLLLRLAFESLGYRRIVWKCNALNAASQRAARRFGFAYEGLFRNHLIVKGRNRDTAWFSMLEEEWSDRKREFEQWLDDGNFDEGRQIHKLEHFRVSA